MTTRNVDTRDLTVHNQADFKKNVNIDLDLTVGNTLRTNGTVALSQIAGSPAGQPVPVNDDLCVDVAKKIQCEKIEPKENELVMVQPIMLNRFGIGRVWYDGAPIPLQINNTGGLDPAPQLPPDNNQVIPFNQRVVGEFGYVDMITTPPAPVGTWKAPALSDIAVCPFTCVFVQVCIVIHVDIQGGELGDRIILDLRKNGTGGDIVSRAVHTIKATCGPPPGPLCETQLCICDIVKCDPDDTLDIFLIGHDIDTTGGVPLQVELLGGTSYHTHASFKIGDLEFD